MNKLLLVIFTSILSLVEVNGQGYPNLDIEQVSGNVHLAVFKRPDNGARIGSKITILKGEDGLLLVDGSFSQIYQLTRIKLKEFSDQPVKYVINTHFHPDHAGANPNFIKDSATVIAHESFLEILSKEQKGHGLSAVDSEDVFPAVSQEGLPNKVFKKDMALTFNDEKIKITHYPKAHTNGDAVVFFNKANVFDMGDIIWPGSFAFVDWVNGGSAQGVLDAVNSVLKQSNKDTKYISGHAPVISLEELKEYRDMLSETISIVNENIEAGLTLEQAQEKGLPEKYAKWSGSLSPENVWIEMIYKSI